MGRPWLRVVGLLLLGAVLVPTHAEARRYAAIVLDARTGQTLYAAEADRWVYPASLTKMMTLYMTFEALEAGRLAQAQQLPVSAEAAARPPSKLGLRPGQRIRTWDAVLALVTRSANDAAVVLAEAIGGNEARFARLMTERARGLGLTATTFRNASGLPDDQQRTTARDMAILALRLQRDFPQYYTVFATDQFAYGGRVHRNHNRLLESYDGTDGVKTGYIRASGFNLVASVERDGRRLIGVVIGGETAASRNAHMVHLLDAAFARIGPRQPVWAGLPPPRRPAGAIAVAAAAPTPAATTTPSESPAEVASVPVRRPPASATETVRLVTAPSPGVAPEPATSLEPLRVVIPAAPPPATAIADAAVAHSDTEFGVQIGAFATAVAAHRAAAAVAEEAPSILRGSVVEVSATSRDGQTLYRARRMGLDRSAAVAACAFLAGQGQPCLVVQRRGLETAVVGAPAG